MATPRADSYAAASGAAVAGGRAALQPPAWLPPAGQFANISLNTMHSARPSGWPNTESAGPFANWSGAVWAPDFGPRGGYAVHGSGHLTPGSPIWAGVWVFDIESQLWVGRNVPSAPLVEVGTGYPLASYYNTYFESIVGGTEGHTYAPHTYDGLIYRSAANGGGADGTLVRNFHAGSGIANARCVHAFDLSSPSAPPTRVIGDVSMAGSSSSYPQAALDEARGGYWLLTYNGPGPMKFVKFSDWSVTNFASVSYSDYGDQHMVYLPPPYDAILCFGRTDSGAANWSYWVSVITDGVPAAFAPITVSGTPPASAKTGGQWSTLLSCVVSYNGGGSYSVHKFAPPSAANVRAGAGTWTWSTETLTGVAGATPATRAADESGMYGRFVEAPELGCFLLANGISAPVQAWRLPGM